MTQLKILNYKERKLFDSVPIFGAHERQLYFSIDTKTRRRLGQLKTPVSRVGYLLQLGYFKSMGKFYHGADFKKRDINFVKRSLGIKGTKNIFSKNYSKTTHYEHQVKILKQLNWSPIGEHSRKLLQAHARQYAELQRKPRLTLRHLIDSCWKHQIVIPSYSDLATLVSEAYNQYENTLLIKLESVLLPSETMLLDELLEHDSAEKHPMTLLKSINQSMKPRDINASVSTFNRVSPYFYGFESVLNKLELTDSATQYFSRCVTKSRPSQLRNLSNRVNSYLHLISYFRDQVYSRQDAFSRIFLKAVNQSLNNSRKQLYENDIKTRKDRNKAIKELSISNKGARELIDDLILVRKTPDMVPNEKYYKIENLLDDYEDKSSGDDMGLLKRLEEQLLREANDDNFYDIMAKLSRKLQLRVSSILKVLVFNEENEKPELFDALTYYQLYDGEIKEDAPTSFLTPTEYGFVTANDKFSVSLYKYLLFVHIADAIKSGAFNLAHSYAYRSIQDYLISKTEWRTNREKLIQLAGLSEFQDIDAVLTELKCDLDEKYSAINKDYLSKNNPYLSLSGDGRIQISTPKTDYDQSGFIGRTLLQQGFVPIQRILSDINGIYNFDEAFTHYKNKNVKSKPSLATLTAGIIGIGCNIGLDKIVNISHGVNENTLKNTVNWCFDLKNIAEANRILVKAINSQTLSNSFGKSSDMLYSSSDGRKIGVAVDSLLASRSYKYFGKDQGVVIYTFIDDRHALYYSTVISASEREAPYVLDGLSHNEVEKPIFHSVDEHGTSEIVHGATHLFGVSFAPRFKQIGTKRLWGMSSKASFQRKGYPIVPQGTINQKIIKEQWENILRFMATIKLNRAPASYLFNRLNSYARKNPLYKGLQEFGKITKTIYILSYCNDLELRQDVQKNLGRIELSNKFSHAVFFDNDQEFQVGSPEEQEIAVGVHVLLQNCIVLWNCLSLSEIIINTKDDDDREELIESILKGSLTSWRHVNMRGSYDFRRMASNQPRFNMDKIRELKIA
ncbi:MAG: Tn3 family transposase [Gammaproteobacteria bacterium]|nr:Tn3 family transposase [Gammaproteobacteria bacterium]